MNTEKIKELKQEICFLEIQLKQKPNSEIIKIKINNLNHLLNMINHQIKKDSNI